MRTPKQVVIDDNKEYGDICGEDNCESCMMKMTLIHSRDAEITLEHENAILKARANPNLRDAYLGLIDYLKKQIEQLKG